MIGIKEYNHQYYASHKKRHKELAKAWYETNRESVIAKAKEHYEKNKKRHHQQSAEYRKVHPEQALAHAAVNNAIQRGKLVKPTSCQDCGREARIESHHYKGYAKEHRMDVHWLCRRCHMQRHHG